MAITNPQPPQIDGITYDFLGVSLAMSTTPRDGRMVLSIAVTLTPYRHGPDGPELSAEGQLVLVYGDAGHAAQSDPHLAQFLEALETAGQAFISTRI